MFNAHLNLGIRTWQICEPMLLTARSLRMYERIISHNNKKTENAWNEYSVQEMQWSTVAGSMHCLQQCSESAIKLSLTWSYTWNMILTKCYGCSGFRSFIISVLCQFWQSMVYRTRCKRKFPPQCRWVKVHQNGSSSPAQLFKTEVQLATVTGGQRSRAHELAWAKDYNC